METRKVYLTDSLSRDEFHSLIQEPAGSCVSLFLPHQRADIARQQHPIRLERMLGQTEPRLLARGLSLAATQSLLAPAWQLVEDRDFWAHPSAGLAIFAAPHFFRVYWLPLDFEELVIVDERPHITPLLPLFSGDGTFFVLALGLKGVHLLQGTRSTIRSIALPSAPAGLQDALKYDEFAKQPQSHPGVGEGGGARGPIFHGQGARDDLVAKEEILRYFKLVDHAVHTALHAERAPLLLAGIAYLLPLYREVNTYPHLAREQLAGNTAQFQVDELHARAWALLAPDFAHQCEMAVERYRQLIGDRPALTSNYLRGIVPAAHTGRIDTLFVAIGQRCWGSFDPDSSELSIHDEAKAGDSELLNLTALQTLLHGGTVYALAASQMPEPAPL
ncbi:MAG TPA: hypothetical protein VFX76_13185, partial [Roseiflexaceae bacterium]|nr:hypothetical protein [Roseiflexaceae bacterium]